MNWTSIGKYAKNILAIIGFLALLNIIPRFKSYDLRLVENTNSIEMIIFTWWKQKSESYFIFYRESKWQYINNEDRLKTVPFKKGIYDVLDFEPEDSDSIFGY